MGAIQSFFNGLTGRIITLMTLALLPLGLISIHQTRAVVTEAIEQSRAALLGETAAAAAAERELIQRLLGAAQGIGMAVVGQPLERCQDLLIDFVDQHAEVIFAGFVQGNGIMECASRGETLDFSKSERFQNAMANRGPLVNMSPSGAVTGRSVVLVSAPVIRYGELAGYLTVSVPHEIVDALIGLEDDTSDLELAAINTEGLVISATGGIDSDPGFLPQAVPLEDLNQRLDQAFEGLGRDGIPRVYAVSRMIDDRVVLLGARSDSDAVEARRRVTLALLFPLFMWCAGIGVAYFGLQRLVVRHIRSLRSAMRRFALGDRAKASLTLPNAPEELDEAKRAFNRMALLISEAEAEQERNLQDKTVLLREVHHRVKNNLQLIASIMNMQARNARSPEAIQILEGLQRRVRGLAMLHRTLYTSPDMTTIDAADLVRTVVADVVQMAQNPDQKIETRLENVLLYPDQALPLSMLMAEALTNALKYAGSPDDTPAHIAIALWVEGDTEGAEEGDVVIEVTNSKGENALFDRDAQPAESMRGLGSKLIMAFVRQLEGTHTIEDTEDQYRLTLRFNPRGFEDGRS